MLRTLIHRPIGVIMSTIAVIAISLVFVRNVPISLLPDIPIPKLSVHISAPDLDARTLETTITRVIRNQLIQVNHLKDIESHSRNGSAIIDLTLNFGTDTDLSSIEINEKIDQIISFLPRELERPRIIKTNVADIPVFYLDIWPQNQEAEGFLSFSSFVRKTVKKRLEQIDEIAFVDVHGGSQAEILVIPHQDILRSLNISEQQLSLAINNANLNIGNVILRDGAYQYNVQLASRLSNIDDIRKVYLRIHDQIYQLDQLAEVISTAQEQRGSFYYGSAKGISLAIRAKSNANNFILRRNIEETLADLRSEHSHISFELSRDQSSVLEASIDNLRTSLLYGLGFAAIVMFFFFRDWRLPLLISISLPIGILLTLFGFFIFDISINVISLAGLILGIGLMIDNAIIIIENIKQKIEQSSLSDAAVNGASEVIRPLISSALTTTSVFLPMILISGLAGVLFYDQALSIALALSSSLIVSYFLLPVLATLVLRSNKRSKGHHGISWHSQLISFCLRSRIVLIPLFLLLGVATILPYKSLKKSAFPELTRYDYVLDVDWNEPISLQANEHRYHLIKQLVDTLADQSTAYVGKLDYFISSEVRQLNESQIYFRLSQPEQFNQIPHRLDQFFSQDFPRASYSILPVANVFDRVFATDEYAAYAHILPTRSTSLPDSRAVQPLIQELNTIETTISSPPTDRYVGLTIHQDVVARYQVNFNQVIQQLKTLFKSNEITQLQSTDDIIPIQLARSEGVQDIQKALKSSFIQNERLALIPLSQLVSTDYLEDYKTIHAIQSGECLTFPLDAYSPTIMSKLKNVIKDNYPEYAIQFSGAYFEELALRKELLLVGGVVFLLLFLILAAQFESLIQPLIVALTLPVGILGALVALQIMGASLNIVAIIGIIIMSGIDVNDAILKIDMINKGVREGLPIRQAIIEGSERRIRPIIMTSITTILAMTPILFATGLGAEIQRPMAIAVIGGLIFGTIASIVMVPMLYLVTYRSKSAT